jgi:hypothetical protein
MSTRTPIRASLLAVALAALIIPPGNAMSRKSTYVQEYTAPSATTEAAYGYFVGETEFGPVKSKRLGFVGFTAPADADRFTFEVSDDTGLPVAAWLAYRNPAGKTVVTLVCGGGQEKPLAFDTEGWVTVWPAAGRCDNAPSAPTHGEVTVNYLSD